MTTSVSSVPAPPTPPGPPGPGPLTSVPLAVEHAARWRPLLMALTWSCVGLGVVTGLAIPVLWLFGTPVLAGVLALPAMGMLVAAAGLLPALLLTSARQRVAGQQ